MQVEQVQREYKKGISYALSSYFMWGLLPIYWKSISNVDSYEILCWRVVLSLVFMFALIFLTGKKEFWMESRRIFKNRKVFLSVFVAGFIVTLNWMIFIVAVNNGKIVQTSLGYYINPLISILFGIYYFKERLNAWLKIAFVLAAVGVVIMIVRVGEIPWISFSLAITFAIYGLIKKTLSVSVVTGLTLETLFMTPFCAAYIYYRYANGVSALQGESFIQFLVMLSGIITAVPLLLFSAGAKLLPLNILGFLQYISPTLSLLVGVFVYKEVFTANHFIAFAFIWMALLVFTLSQTVFFNKWVERIFLSNR